MICWYCYWGWPKAVANIYDANGGPDLDYGPGHVVWADENFDDESIEFCLKECDEWAARPFPDDGSNSDQFRLAIARQSLVELLGVPESVRVPRPDYFELEIETSPEIYPPPPDFPMVKR